MTWAWLPFRKNASEEEGSVFSFFEMQSLRFLTRIDPLVPSAHLLKYICSRGEFYYNNKTPPDCTMWL